MTAAPDEAHDSSAELFRPVSVGRTAQVIVDQIRGLIRSGTLPIGVRLPSERELCSRFQVSRVTLREALRMLEANGLVEIRVGSRGGAFVTAPSAGHIVEGITDLLSMSALTAAQVTETREILELGIVEVVCARRTDQDIQDLHRLCDEAAEAREAGTYTVAMSFDFHLRLASASHNPAFALLMASFREPVLMSMREAHHEGRQGVDEHRAVVEAVAARDTAGARRILEEHLKRTARRVGRA